jgi:glutathionylspermidine synthase
MSTAAVAAGPADDYVGFARRLTASGLVTDPWVDGAPRFQAQPLPLARADHDAMARAAEAVAAVLDELGHIVCAAPALLDDFFALTPVQSLMWKASAPLWHGIARADVFLRDGAPPAVCEMNCDTPSGLAEAVCLSALAAPPGAVDPNRALAARFAAVLSRFAARAPRRRDGGPATVGIVYPTEQPDDLGLVALYRRWCEDAGFDVVIGSPFNLRPLAAGGVAMFDRRCDVVLRHYKTDWWGERLPLRDDEPPFPDPEPLSEPLRALLAAELAGEVAVMNPFGAVLPQNKRAYAFCWEAIDRFSAESQAVIRAVVPYTLRLEAAARDELLRAREDWVLKSDYGCEGEEVIVGREVTDEVWADWLAHALPRRWVAQRHFEARRDAAGRAANHGVFVVAGCAAGLYTRLSARATDATAVSVAPVIVP